MIGLMQQPSVGVFFLRLWDWLVRRLVLAMMFLGGGGEGDGFRSGRLFFLRIGQNVNTLWNNPIQVCIAYFNKDW